MGVYLAHGAIGSSRVSAVDASCCSVQWHLLLSVNAHRTAAKRTTQSEKTQEKWFKRLLKGNPFKPRL